MAVLFYMAYSSYCLKNECTAYRKAVFSWRAACEHAHMHLSMLDGKSWKKKKWLICSIFFFLESSWTVFLQGNTPKRNYTYIMHVTQSSAAFFPLHTISLVPKYNHRLTVLIHLFIVLFFICMFSWWNHFSQKKKIIIIFGGFVSFPSMLILSDVCCWWLLLLFLMKTWVYIAEISWKLFRVLGLSSKGINYAE